MELITKDKLNLNKVSDSSNENEELVYQLKDLNDDILRTRLDY